MILVESFKAEFLNYILRKGWQTWAKTRASSKAAHKQCLYTFT